MNFAAIMQNLAIWALPVLFAIVLHEVAHGWVADRLGDPTARWMGRLTLNPIKHIDPVGTLLIPALLLFFGSPFLFGYAKPVPVDFRRLNRPKRDMVWVALAGPAVNLLLAIISTLLLMLAVVLPYGMGWVAKPLALMCQASIMINMVLCIFNLLPLPPLDGGRVAVGLLPEPWSYRLAQLERFGFVIVVVLLLSGALQTILAPLLQLSAGNLIDFAMGRP